MILLYFELDEKQIFKVSGLQNAVKGIMKKYN
jgi:hypothetical protein